MGPSIRYIWHLNHAQVDATFQILCHGSNFLCHGSHQIRQFVLILEKNRNTNLDLQHNKSGTYVQYTCWFVVYFCSQNTFFDDNTSTNNISDLIWNMLVYSQHRKPFPRGCFKITAQTVQNFTAFRLPRSEPSFTLTNQLKLLI